MAAADRIHDAVRNALVKDGWTITEDPFTIDYEEVTLFADLGAQRPIGARRAGQKIVVEAKSFIGPSRMQDFKEDQVYLEENDSERTLFLAIDEETYYEFFQWRAIQVIVDRFRVALFVVDVKKEEIAKWKS